VKDPIKNGAYAKRSRSPETVPEGLVTVADVELAAAGRVTAEDWMVGADPPPPEVFPPAPRSSIL